MLADNPLHHPNGIIVPSYGAGGTPSNRRRPQDGAKLGIHSTQTEPGTGRAVARKLKSAYTGYVEVKRREYLESLPLNWTAHSLKGGPGIEETNHSGRMHPQLAFVGFAETMEDLTDADLDWLAEVVFAPILAACNIPNNWLEFHGPNDGIGPPWIASAESELRMSYQEFYRFSGVYGHQNAPNPNDHWDPGKLDGGRISKLITDRNVPKPAPDPIDNADTARGHLVAALIELGQVQQRVDAALSALVE